MQELESSQEDTDTIITPHRIHGVSQDDTECGVVHANDIDVILFCTYYCSNETYTPMHQVATSLGFSFCQALPSVHSLGGRDETSCPYFVGKKAWVSEGKDIDISAIKEFAEVNDQYEISPQFTDQAKVL